VSGAAVALNAACVAYGGQPVLGPLSLQIGVGERVAVAGPSGCGKSTLLRLLAGLEAPTAGAVDRGGLQRGETAVVFQAPTLAPWADALSNVALPLRLSGVTKPEANRRAADALAAVGLADALRKRPAQLSGGMAMRCALARALVTRPRLMLLDEPFAALDDLVRRRLADDLLRLQAAQGFTLVLVTHAMEEAAYVAQRVAVLTPGPGRLAAKIASPGPSPRPEGWRRAPEFRLVVEAVAAGLERGCASADGVAA
jgi:NitT/TauT family transport system ATP-binding protein